MPTTTKMGIVYPSSTDLVKDGATAMGTISTTVDAKTGMVLLNTTTFTGVSSVSLPQDTFTTTFRNYHIRLNVSGSASTTLRMRLRAAGVDASAASYFWAVTRASYASGAFGGFGGNGVDYFEVTDLANSSTDVYDAQINIYRPKEAVVTNLGVSGRGSANGAVTISGHYNTTVSYDAISLYPVSGNITGFIQVYGCNQ